ncbi:uncharacterized protein [Malus domestica]|uniref:uncharacterized protein n=1 Tax=Malus domestica TaxID=3750 RepID=UPI003975149C
MWEIDQQEEELFNQLEGMFNLQVAQNEMEDDKERRKKDDEARMARTSHSRRVIQAVAQICKPNYSANLDRSRPRRGTELLDNCFVHNSAFPDTYFKRCYRMERHLFNKIMIAICNHDSYFVQKNDAFGAMGPLHEQKIIVALQMLAYRASADQVNEIVRMGKSTILESLMRFCRAIEFIYTAEYLQKPTEMDLQRLLKKGAQNDLNVLTQSPVFNDVLQGKASKVTYWVNECKYDGPYFLADGIYPRWSKFVKTVQRSRSTKEKHFASCQEGCRKDVKRCFGILQARWTIVMGAAKMFDVESFRSIMMTCIILHNMIVKDEYAYDAIDEYEPDTMNNSKT